MRLLAGMFFEVFVVPFFKNLQCGRPWFFVSKKFVVHFFVLLVKPFQSFLHRIGQLEFFMPAFPR